MAEKQVMVSSAGDFISERLIETGARKTKDGSRRRGI